MKTIAKIMLLAASIMLLASCAQSPDICTPGRLNITDKIVTVDLQIDPVPEAPKVGQIREKVLFDFDSFKLDAEAEGITGKVANLMDKFPDTMLLLQGHTDKHGPANYNQTLSENRANAVRDSLLAKGVDLNNISKIEGFGKRQLIPNLTDRENRRVLILSIGGK